MWKKHKKELIGCAAATLGIVIALLIMVSAFEYFKIHVPGSREMWIGLIGAVIGGAFTLFGVLITIYKQEEIDDEKRRLENMPILGFEVCFNGQGADMALTYLQNELITSAFSIFESKIFATIVVRPINNLCAFNFGVEQCVINGKLALAGKFFNPSKERIAIGENTRFAFDYDDLKNSVFCLVRFSYEDIFGNRYFQDLPFSYDETTMYEGDSGRIRQIIEIRDIKQPILVNDNVKTLEDIAKDYVDYDIFSDK